MGTLSIKGAALSSRLVLALCLAHMFLMVTFYEFDPTPRQHMRTDAHQTMMLPRSSNNSHHEAENRKSRFAYAFVLGGINREVPSYRGMIYSIFVAVHALQTYGSKADVVLYVQSTDQNATVDSSLTVTERRVAEEMNIQLRYLQSSESAHGFHDITMSKFIILNLTEYEKVLFLDADIVPLNNLDYIFTTSVLRSTFTIATAGEPANAGFFMVSPRENDYEMALDIMEKQRASAQNVSGKVKFDMVKGWGHVIEPPDEWETTRLQGKTSRDQGFLYYWTKYFKKDTSIMVRDELKSFGAHPNGTVRLESVLRAPLDGFSADFENRQLKKKWHKPCHNRRFAWECVAPHRDYIHLAGSLKPWRRAIPEGAFGVNKTLDAWSYWFYVFHEVNDEYNLGVDFDKWEEERQMYLDPPLGWKPEYYPKKCTGCKFW